jgi:3-hydroxyisobutyrate dehydrogenase-like beta-hydroxyacid dehydrogenase
LSQVGFVGAGRMGAPMVRRLVEAGHEVCALGRSVEKRRAVSELGARPVTDLADVGAEADVVVVVCVFTDEQVQQVCLESVLLTTMRAESVLVIHTTGSPRTAENVAAEAASHGIDVIDAPVSGGPHDIAAGHVTLFVGGSDEAIARARPVLSSYGDPILHVGPIGAGQGVKLVNNTLFAAQIGLLHEAVRLGDRLGIDEQRLLDAIGHGSAANRVASIVGARGSVDAFIDMVGEFVGKDVAVVRKTAAELGSDLGLLDDAINAGFRGKP